MGKSYGMAIIFSIGILLTLSSMLVPQFKAENPHERDILLQALGGTAEFAADKAYQEADVYFHAGLRDDHHHHEHEYE